MASLSEARVARLTSRWLTDELNSFARFGNWEGALQTFEQMQQSNLVRRNVFHYTTVLTACTRAGQMDAAMTVFRQMKVNQVTPNVYTYTTLINGCANAKNLDLALRIFAEMRLVEVPPNVKTMTALISVCSRCGQWKKGFQVLDQCEELFIAPNALTYTAAMDGCRRACVCTPAVALLERRMTDPSQVRPNEVTYNTVLGACAAAKDHMAALRVYARMVADGYEPIEYTRELLTEVLRGTSLDGLALNMSVRVRASKWEVYVPDSDPATALRAAQEEG
ncbi:Pentacotripeptide-repeat region of PRORP/PPR repeat/Pentatricopeptide repeat domain [Leishmania shawi]|uniref:Pentacotripeptide-repeat region of PRORP/PPR repeat/Pentatricopeptide repeat domain n=1 Tax=Leishmania shawi TaxID=5680 RepID=A0AAW3B6V8_9TRYP